jgi:hypothetical protein
MVSDWDGAGRSAEEMTGHRDGVVVVVAAVAGVDEIQVADHYRCR